MQGLIDSMWIISTYSQILRWSIYYISQVSFNIIFVQYSLTTKFDVAVRFTDTVISFRIHMYTCIIPPPTPIVNQYFMSDSNKLSYSIQLWHLCIHIFFIHCTFFVFVHVHIIRPPPLISLSLSFRRNRSYSVYHLIAEILWFKRISFLARRIRRKWYHGKTIW